MSADHNLMRRPLAAGTAVVLGLAAAMTVAPMQPAAADGNDRGAAAAAGFAAGAVVGATVAQPRVYVAPRPGYVRSGYGRDCRTKVVKQVNSAGRSVTKKTTVCN